MIDALFINFYDSNCNLFKSHKNYMNFRFGIELESRSPPNRKFQVSTPQVASEPCENNLIQLITMGNGSKKVNTFLFIGMGILVLFKLWLLIPAWQNPDRFLEIDSLQYLELSKALIQKGVYRSDGDPGLDLVRPPGYPLFMVPGIILGSGSTRFVSIFQVLLSFGTAFLLYKICRELKLETVGLIAAAIFLVNPNASFWSMVILTETLAGFLLTGAIYMVVRFERRPDNRCLYGAGLFIGLAVISRPIFVPLFFLFAVVIAYFIYQKKISRPSKIALLFVFFLGYTLITVPWQTRNLIVHNSFSISSVGQSTIENWMVAKVVAEIEGISRSDAASQIAMADNPTAYSFEIFKNNPGIFIREQLRGLLRTLLGSEYVTWARIWGGQEIQSTGFLSHFLAAPSLNGFLNILTTNFSNGWFLLGVYALIFDFFLYASCVVGIKNIFQYRHFSPFLILGILVLFSILYLVVVPFAAGESRFRVPADPLLGLLAGIAFARRDIFLKKQLS